MKFEFNTRGYQDEAVQSVVDLFEDQPTYNEKLDNSYSTASHASNTNTLDISNDILLRNLNDVQERNTRETAEIELSKELNTLDYSVEMETGTGKTFVYFKTIVELAKTYGWKKYIIVVPSVAIKEGVQTEFDRVKSYLESQIKQPVSLTTYESKNINELGTYYRSNMVEILLMTMQSFNSDNNVLNKDALDLEVGKPIKLIQDLRPIVILDEPQKMGGEATTKGLANFNPLFTLRYSATHKELINPIFRYTPVDAYNDGFVKKIEVLSIHGNNEVDVISYVEVKEIDNDIKGDLYAKLKFYRVTDKGIKYTTRKVKLDSDLYELSNQMPEYRGYKVSEINLTSKTISFKNGIELNEQTISQNKDDIMRIQIKETIQTHFEKELKLSSQGIKVLSLFFIDKVVNYRDLTDPNQKGKIRKWFEESYEELTSQDEYKQFSIRKLTNDSNINNLQAAYFSKDKEGYRDTSGNTKTYDDETYNLIMRDKETLLSFDNPVRFIFSHSALREGWDNPNVFQICTLNETVSEVKKRQEIGRGLRLPVNQDGKRITDDENRVLTITVNDSYESFARELQKEISIDTGIQTSSAPVENARTRKKVELNKDALVNPEFQKLWNRINKKTKYHINIQDEEVVSSIVNVLNNQNFTIELPEISIKKSTMNSYIDADKERIVTDSKTIINRQKRRVPNVIKRIADNTGLTKKNVIKIIQQTNIEKYILIHPEEFISRLTQIIKSELPKIFKKGIEYKSTGDVYELSLFKDQIEVYTDNKLISPQLINDGETLRTLYELVQLDSKNEVKLVEDFNANIADFKFFVKLPSWFKVQTPVGPYNPDWGLVYEHNGNDKLYLMRESKKTKGKHFSPDELRSVETLKIEYSKKHFDEINVDFQVIETVEDVSKGIYPFNKNQSIFNESEKESFIKKYIKPIKEFDVPYETAKDKYTSEFNKYKITGDEYNSI